MPWSVKKGGGTCGADKWAVLNKDNGKTMGCHTTEESAKKQLAALNANVEESEVGGDNKLHEQIDLAEAARTADKKSGVLNLQLIDAGWGSSGYYSAEVCESAAPMFAAGTQMFLDHPRADGSGLDIHGNRSLRDLAAVITESGTWDASTRSVRAKAKVTPPFRELLCDEDLAKNIGLSVRGAASGIAEGEAEGRTGPIIESITDVKSVDFVTKAGRGGKVLQVIESAKFVESTADDRALQLSDAVRSAYPDEGTYAYVLDMDAERTVVWYQVSGESGAAKTYEQTYGVSDNDVRVQLTGEPREVARTTTYVPVDPAGPVPTQESKEDTVGQITIDESEHSDLVTRAGRVDTLESELETTKAERDQLRRERRISRARELIAEAAEAGQVTFSVLETKGLVAEVPLTDKEELDEEKFRTSVNESVAEKKEAAGAGKVTGQGSTQLTESGSGSGTKSPTEFWGEIDESLGIQHEKTGV